LLFEISVGARQLRSANTRTLTVHRTSSCFGDMTFCRYCSKRLEQFAIRLTKSRLVILSVGSGGRWRHFYFDSPTTAHCELH